MRLLIWIMIAGGLTGYGVVDVVSNSWSYLNGGLLFSGVAAIEHVFILATKSPNEVKQPKAPRHPRRSK